MFWKGLARAAGGRMGDPLQYPCWEDESCWSRWGCVVLGLGEQSHSRAMQQKNAQERMEFLNVKLIVVVGRAPVGIGEESS